MKLSDMDAVYRLSEQRKTLNRHYDEIYEQRKNVLGVTINGTYQGDDFLQAVRPVVLDVLMSQIAKIDAQLNELGVRIGS